MAQMGKRSLFFMGTDEYSNLNPPVIEIVEDENGKLYGECLSDDRWIEVGYIPTPSTRIGWFVYHFVHGLAMRYRFLPVLIFSIRNSFFNMPMGDSKVEYLDATIYR